MKEDLKKNQSRNAKSKFDLILTINVPILTKFLLDQDDCAYQVWNQFTEDL